MKDKVKFTHCLVDWIKMGLVGWLVIHRRSDGSRFISSQPVDEEEVATAVPEEEQI